MEQSLSNPARIVGQRLNDANPRASRPGRLARFVALFSEKASREAFEAWLNNPVTQAYVSALRELAYLPYANGIIPIEGNAYAQYGMTLAFQTAERLMTDPESIVPVFGASRDEDVEPESPYNDPPDSVVY